MPTAPPPRRLLHGRDSKTVRDWAVLRFLLAQDPAPVPEHAFVYYGDEWKCDRGFKRVDDRCEEIQVPEHAFLAYTGNRWQCERGYKRGNEQCLGP